MVTGRRRWLGCSAGALLSVIAIVAFFPGPEPARATGGQAVLPIRAMGVAADDHPTGEACLSRIAIDVTFGSVCTDPCVTDAQCPSEWGCKTIQQGNGTDLGLCFPRRL